MVINFDKCEVKVNETGLLAQSASLSTTNSLLPVRILGRRSVAGYAPQAPRESSLQANYVVDMLREPNYDIMTGIRDLEDDTVYQPPTVSLGNVSGEGYLSRFSIGVSPNGPIECNVSYDIFHETSGALSPKVESQTGNMDAIQIAHSWGMVVKSPEGYRVDPTYSLSYDFQADWEPIYPIGQTDPSQVIFNGARENIFITRDEFSGASFSGDAATGFLLSIDAMSHLDLRDIDEVCKTGSLELLTSTANRKIFDLSEARITSSEIVANIDDMVRVRYSIVKEY